MKYELTNHDIIDDLQRLRALVDIPGVVKAGEYGGLVSSSDNLAQVGRCWVSYRAKVTLNGRVLDHAQVYGRATVTGCATVRGNAHVLEDAFLSGHVLIEGFAQVCGTARLCQSSHLYGFALRTENSLVILDKPGSQKDLKPRQADYAPYRPRLKWI